MHCSNCGHEIHPEAMICVHCGVGVQKHVESKDGRIGGLGIVCFLFPIVGLILYLVWSNSMPIKARGAGKSALWGIIWSLAIVVISVVISSTVGVTLFNKQAYDQNKSALALELHTCASEVVQWWKTPMSQGGAGQMFPQENAEQVISSFLGFGDGPGAVLVTPSGRVKIRSARSEDNIEIWGVGVERKRGKYPLVKTIVNLRDGGTITSTSDDASDVDF